MIAVARTMNNSRAMTYSKLLHAFPTRWRFAAAPLFTFVVFFGSPWSALPVSEGSSIRNIEINYGAPACKNIFSASRKPFGSRGVKSYFDAESRLNALLNKRSELYNAEDLRFLYQLDGAIPHYGVQNIHQFYGRLFDLQRGRNLRADLSLALGVRQSQISTTDSEALRGGIKFHFGNLTVKKANFDLAFSPRSLARKLWSRVSGKPPQLLPEVVLGHVELRGFTSFENVAMPRSILGNLTFVGSADFSGLTPPAYVRGYTSAEHHRNTSIFAGSEEIL